MKRYIATTVEPPYGRRGTDTRRRHFTPTQKSNVYDAIVGAGDDGLNRHEIAQAVGLAVDRIGFYLSDLRRSGFIAIKGDPATVNPNMGEKEAAYAAMLGLENAIVARIKARGATPDMDRTFVKYTKVKELALRPGTGPEGDVAIGTCLTQLVKLVWLSS